jgi:hypothetical protein
MKCAPLEDLFLDTSQAGMRFGNTSSATLPDFKMLLPTAMPVVIFRRLGSMGLWLVESGIGTLIACLESTIISSVR